MSLNKNNKSISKTKRTGANPQHNFLCDHVEKIMSLKKSNTSISKNRKLAPAPASPSPCELECQHHQSPAETRGIDKIIFYRQLKSCFSITISLCIYASTLTSTSRQGKMIPLSQRLRREEKVIVKPSKISTTLRR